MPIQASAAYTRNTQSLQYSEQTTILNRKLVVNLYQHGGPITGLTSVGPIGTPYSRGIEWTEELSREMVERIKDQRQGNDFTWTFHLTEFFPCGPTSACGGRGCRGYR